VQRVSTQRRSKGKQETAGGCHGTGLSRARQGLSRDHRDKKQVEPTLTVDEEANKLEKYEPVKMDMWLAEERREVDDMLANSMLSSMKWVC
jgi:hypothetical protein